MSKSHIIYSQPIVSKMLESLLPNYHLLNGLLRFKKAHSLWEYFSRNDRYGDKNVSRWLALTVHSQCSLQQRHQLPSTTYLLQARICMEIIKLSNDSFWPFWFSYACERDNTMCETVVLFTRQIYSQYKKMQTHA